MRQHRGLGSHRYVIIYWQVVFDFINDRIYYCTRDNLCRRHIDIRSDDDAFTDFYPAAAACGLIYSSSCTRSNERKAWPNRIGFHAVPIH